MRTYLDLMQRVLDEGVAQEDRTGTGTLSLFGAQMRFDLSDGFPLLTTKKLHLRSIIVELLWFPSDEDGLRRTFADAHRRYTGFVNARHRWIGHLWQGRFGAVVMDEAHLAHAMRYVSLNPVRARLVERAEDWPWSSVRAHLAGEDDKLVQVAPALDRYGRFADFLGAPEDYADAWRALRRSETTGRPLGGADWIASIEAATGRILAPRKPGPKPKENEISALCKLAP